MMKVKAATLTLCGLALGFLSARWIPGFPGPDLPATPPGHALNQRHRPPAVLEASKKPARSLNLEGDWQTEAKAWAKEDPAGLRDWLVERGIPPKKELLETLFREWARRDADAAFEAVFNLPPDFNRQEGILPDMLSSLLESPARLASVLKWAPQVEEQINGWGWPGDAWLKEGPPESAAKLISEAVKYKKSYGGYTASLAQMLAKHWAASDTSAALDWAHSLPPGNERSNAAAGVISAWTAKDPQAVLDFLATTASSAERWNAYEPLSKIAEKDPRAAMDWFEKNRGIPDPNCIPHIYRQWCQTDEAGAVKYAMEIDDPILRQDCLRAWTGAAKPESIWTAFNGSTDSENRTSILTEVAGRFLGVGPNGDDATSQFRQMISEGKIPEITPEIAATAARTFSYNSPREAMEWAASLPAPLQPASVTEAVRQWSGKDRVAAAQAVENLPDGPAKTAAREALSKSP